MFSMVLPNTEHELEKVLIGLVFSRCLQPCIQINAMEDDGDMLRNLVLPVSVVT